MKKSTQCSIRNCPLWKRVKLITGIALVLSPLVTTGIYIGLADWKGLLFVMGALAVVFAVISIGILLIDDFK